MRIQEHVILSALQKGVCIKTFYRTSARAAGSTDRRIPDGYVLESLGERNEVILSHTESSRRWNVSPQLLSRVKRHQRSENQADNLVVKKLH